MHKFITLFIVFFITLPMFGCHERVETSEMKDQQAVQQQQDAYRRAQPIPKFDYSLERDVVIQLYHARNERVATHTVWRGDTSVVEGHCPSIGYPVPFDTSLTNPLQASWNYAPRRRTGEWRREMAVIEQAEPNGIFASKNSTATWVRCVHDGDEVPVYVEGKVTAYPYPIKVEGNVVSPAIGAKASVKIKKGGAK